VKAQGAPVGNMNAAKQTGHVSGKDDPFVSTADTIAKKGSGMGGRIRDTAGTGRAKKRNQGVTFLEKMTR
jgi:hypothetical protein